LLALLTDVKMDPEDVQDLLFGAAGTHEDLEILWDDSYDDDEILDAADNPQGSDDDGLFGAIEPTTADAWQLLSSPPLTPADTPIASQYGTLMSSADYPTTADRRSPCDRCSMCRVKYRKC
jgi:hypothetical protein